MICKCMDQKRLVCHAGCLEVSRSHTRGEHLGESEESIACRWESAQVTDLPWLWNPGQTSQEVQKREYQWPHKKDKCPFKILKWMEAANFPKFWIVDYFLEAIRLVHTAWFFLIATMICFYFGLHRCWLCCCSHIAWTLPLSPVQPICCDKKNHSCNKKKTHIVEEP